MTGNAQRSQGGGTASLGVPEVGDRTCPWGTRDGDRLGEAHSRGGPAWLPGTVRHGISWRDLEQRPAEVRGSRPPPRWETLGRWPGLPGRGDDPGARRSSGGRLRDPLLRDRVPEAAPRTPQPPPRAGPDFPALFHLLKNFPGTWDAATLQPSVRASSAPMLMNLSLALQLAEDSTRDWVMQISLGAPGGDWLKTCGAAWEVRRAGCGRVASSSAALGRARDQSEATGGLRGVGRDSLKGQ